MKKKAISRLKISVCRYRKLAIGRDSSKDQLGYQFAHQAVILISHNNAFKIIHVINIFQTIRIGQHTQNNGLLPCQKSHECYSFGGYAKVLRRTLPTMNIG